MKQGDAALVGLGLGEFQQRVDLETHSIPRVTSLERTQVMCVGFILRAPEVKHRKILLRSSGNSRRPELAGRNWARACYF